MADPVPSDLRFTFGFSAARGSTTTLAFVALLLASTPSSTVGSHQRVCPRGTLLVHDIIVEAPFPPPVCLQMNNCLPFHSIPTWNGSWERGPEAGMGLVSANREPGTY